MSGFEPRVSARVAAIPPSGIRRFFDIAETIKDCISLGVGEPDYLTPYHIRDEAIINLEKGYTRYSPNAGFSALRRSISRYLERRRGLSYDPNGEILVTVGGSEAIDLAVRAVADIGDEVLIPEPSFVCYKPVSALAGAIPVTIRTYEEDEFRLTPAALKAAITPRTKILVLPYPCNPTGGVMTKPDLEAIAAVLKDTQIAVIADEIYAELTYTGEHVSLAQLPGMRDRVIYVGGLSKSHSMTGWRIGYACAHRDYISQMTKIHQYAIMCAPSTSQYAAAEALDNGDGDIERMREDYDARRRFFVDGLRKCGLSVFEPRGAFYAFPNISASGLTSAEFAERFIVQKRVAVIPGAAFGESGEGFVRCCYASSPAQLRTALERLEEFLGELK